MPITLAWLPDEHWRCAKPYRAVSSAARQATSQDLHVKRYFPAKYSSDNCNYLMSKIIHKITVDQSRTTANPMATSTCCMASMMGVAADAPAKRPLTGLSAQHHRMRVAAPSGRLWARTARRCSDAAHVAQRRCQPNAQSLALLVPIALLRARPVVKPHEAEDEATPVHQVLMAAPALRASKNSA